MPIRRRLVLLTLVLSLSALSAGAEDDLETVVSRMARVNGCWSPSFSPDDERLAFVSDLSGVPQVWIVDVDGGWPDRVTALDDQVGSVSWSPRGDVLAFSLAPGGGMNQQVYLVAPDGTNLRRITDGGQESNWLGGFNHDGSLLSMASNRDGPASMDAYAFDLATGALRQIAQNPGIGTLADLSRDGRRGVVYRMNSRSDDNLVLLDLTSGGEVILTPHDPPGSFGGGVFDPDGRIVYLSSNKDRDTGAFARIMLDEDGRPGPIEVLAARHDAELAGFDLSDDGSLAVLSWNVAGKSELELYSVESGERHPGPDLPSEIAGTIELSHDGRRLAMVLSGSAAPSDVWIYDLPSKRLWQVTRSPHAGVDLGKFVRPELVRYPAHDGLELSGWLYRPPDAKGPAPYVLSFHGGPEGQTRPSFRADFQGLVSRGIGVFAPNVRGSSGFGKRFVNLDNGALRFDGIRDIQSTVSYLVEAGIADGDRLGIMGGSYGGYMTMAGLAWYPELFAAGVNLFGVVNFETFFAETEPWMAAISKVEYGDPDTQAELLRELSPIHRVDRIDDPTLVLHGANDTNVPVVEAEQVVENLRKRGVEVGYILFPDEGHGFRKTPNRIRATVATVQWFVKHLGKGEDSTDQGANKSDTSAPFLRAVTSASSSSRSLPVSRAAMASSR